MWGRAGAGLLEIPATANGRGLREAGVLPDAGPGYKPVSSPGRGAAGIARAATDGELTALYLFQTDPLRDQPDRALWKRALDRASLVVAHASVLTDGLREHADVVFPADSYAEKEGTVVHPDGRIQRLRTAIRRPGQVRAGWWVIEELAKRSDYDNRVLTAPIAFQQLVAAVPFYRGLTLEDVGGRGVRWPPRPEASELATEPLPSERAGLQAQAFADAEADRRASAHGANGALRLGRYRPIWASPEVEVSPALKFTIAQQQVELSPEDARRLGIGNGDQVEVAQNGTRVRARAAVRTGVPPGAAFLADGVAEESANALTEAFVEVRKP
jgi:NADH-quinone oxidoreductase subunit G